MNDGLGVTFGNEDLQMGDDDDDDDLEIAFKDTAPMAPVKEPLLAITEHGE